MLFDKTIFVRTAFTNWRFFLHNKLELCANRFAPIVYFGQTYKIIFVLYVLIRKNTYFYIFIRDIQGFANTKEIQ